MLRLLSRFTSHIVRSPLLRPFSTPSSSRIISSGSSFLTSKNPVVPYFDGINEFGQNGLDIDLDSWSTVQRLESTGFTTKQSEIILDLMTWILRVRLNEFRRSLVTQNQVEYDLSIMSEMFDEIQSSHSVISSRDSVEIRALNDKYSSEITRLLDGLKDSLNSSKTDLAISLNAFKADSLEESQRVGMRLHQEDSKLTVKMGAFKTATENVKLRAIYMFSVVLCIACVMVAAKAKVPKKPKQQPPLVHVETPVIE